MELLINYVTIKLSESKTSGRWEGRSLKYLYIIMVEEEGAWPYTEISK